MKKLLALFALVSLGTLAGCATPQPAASTDAPVTTSLAAPAAAEAAAAPAPTAAAPAAAEAAPTVGQAVANTAAECAKKYAALKACDQMGFVGAKVCRVAAEKKFSSLACQVVN